MRHITRIHLLIALCFLCASVQAQPSGASSLAVITGRVVDEAGEPLAGTTIQEVGSMNAVLADQKGEYAIKVRIGHTLAFLYVGMQERKIKVLSDKPINVTLIPEDISMEDVVVTGYSKVNSRLFVGATTKIATENFDRNPQADLSRLLEGRGAGLNISSVSNTFGSAPKINIRGGGSVNGSVQPLWVVDGAVMDELVPLSIEQLSSGDAITLIGSAVAGLNPADIASVEVLKDASATSLYGARGMNGVIVITTKSGRRGSGIKVTYNLTTSMRLKPKYSQYNLMNSAETTGIFEEMANKGIFTMNSALYGRRGGIYYQMYDQIARYQNGTFGLANTPSAKAQFLKRAAEYNTDWFDQLYLWSTTQLHTLSLAYGGEKNTTYASISVYHDPGQTIPEQVTRLTGNLKNSYYFRENLKVTIGVQASYRNQLSQGAFPRVKNLEAGAYQRNFDINPFHYALSTPRNLRPKSESGQYEYYRNNWAPFNILQEYENNQLGIKLLDIRTYAQAEYSPIKNLTLNALLNARWSTTGMSHRIGKGSNIVEAYRANGNYIVNQDNIYLYRPQGAATIAQVALPHGGIYEKRSRTLSSYLARISADYAFEHGQHVLKSFTFAELKGNDANEDDFTGYGIGYTRANTVSTLPLIFEKTLGEGMNYFSIGDTHDRNITFSSSLTYSYANRYVVNLVGSYEGSNQSGRGSRVRWLPTWNIGAKWNVEQESFMTSVHEILNQLAFRISYGLVAKLNSSAINSLPVYHSGLTFRPNVRDREYAIYLQHLENRDLTWEKMYEFNMGMDMAFLSNRFGFSIDGYLRNSFDLIDLIRTSGIGGEPQKWANFGDMRTIGVDFTAHSENLKIGGFSWSTTLNASYFHQEITRLVNRPTTFDLVSGGGRGNVEGHPRGALYSFDFIGLSDRGLPQFNFGALPSNGRADFAITGANFYDATYNQSYLIYHGPIDPYVNLGIGNTFTWRNISLSIFITGQFGNKIHLAPTFSPEYVDLNVFTTQYRDRWVAKGDENHTNIPVLPGPELTRLIGTQNIERAYNTYNYSQLSVVDGSFLRLKSISLTYNLPRKYCQRIFADRLSINASAQNVALIYADPQLHGRDPEFINAGGVASPSSTIFSLSLNLSF